MDEQRSELTKNVLRDVARALGRKHACQAVFPALLRDQAERVQLHAGVLVADVAPEELVSLVKEDHKRLIPKQAFAGLIEQVSADDVEQDFASVVLEPDIFERDDREVPRVIGEESCQLVDDGRSIRLKKALQLSCVNECVDPRDQRFAVTQR